MVGRNDVYARLDRRTEVDPITGCYAWTGARTRDGYGQIKVDGEVLYTHRVAYAMFVGDLVAGMHVDHLCGNRACWNPEHLEQVTPEENTRRRAATLLSADEVAVIKSQLLLGESVAELAEDFGVSRRAIQHIRAGDYWRDVQPRIQ